MQLKSKVFNIILIVVFAVLSGFILEFGAYFYLKSSQLLVTGNTSLSNAVVIGLERYGDPTDKAFFPHPYFGYTYSETPDSTNNYGFIDSRDFPYQKKEDEFVIGIFGGSVAMILGEYLHKNPVLQDHLKENVVTLKDKRIVLLNMSINGGKQPQQYLVASYFAEMFDLMINVEGFNEASIMNYPLYPADYPPSYELVFTERFHPKTQQLAEYERFAGRLMQLRQDHPGLQRSYFVSLMYKVVMSHINQKRLGIHIDLKGHSAHKKMRGLKALDTDEAKLAEMLAIWDKYVRLQKNLADYYGIPYFVFLQPNQHVPESKPLTPIEESNFIVQKEQKDFLGRGRSITSFIDKITQFSRSGISAYSLVHVFGETRDTVYIDSCCHFNDLGSQIISQKMAYHIANELNSRVLAKNTE